MVTLKSGSRMHAKQMLQRWFRAPVPGKERLSDAEVLKKMQMPSVSSLIASRRVGYAMSTCRCPQDPLLGLLSAHDACPDQWSSLVLCGLLVISTSEFGLEAKLGDPGDHWPVWVSDMILRPAKWKATQARARTEDWWNDPSEGLDEDALECGNIDRSGVPVAFTIEQSTCPCSKIFKKGPEAVATHRMRAHGHRKPMSNYTASDCLDSKVPAHICNMVGRLLDQTWFQIELEGRLIMTTRGSRQGCRFGSVIFNAVYGVTLSELLENIKDHGACLMRDRGSRAPPWSTAATAYTRTSLNLS